MLYLHCTLILLSHTHSFSTLFLMQLTTTRFNSDCADIYVDALRGTATVMFNNSNVVYRYFNVSRRACLNFVNNPNMSVGFWINANLFQKRVECFA